MRSAVVNWRRGKSVNKAEERLDEAFNRGGYRPTKKITLPKIKFTERKEAKDDDEDRS